MAGRQQPNGVAGLAILPPGHWLYDVLHRVDAARLAPPGLDPAAGTLTAGEGAEALRAAPGARRGRHTRSGRGQDLRACRSRRCRAFLSS